MTGVYGAQSSTNPVLVFVTERKDGKITVKLGDFGLAKLETDGTDSYVGTRDYLAPERPSIQFCTRMHTKHLLTLKQEQRSASPNQRTTFKSDIYALGCTSYCFGHRPMWTELT